MCIGKDASQPPKQPPCSHPTETTTATPTATATETATVTRTETSTNTATGTTTATATSTRTATVSGTVTTTAIAKVAPLCPLCDFNDLSDTWGAFTLSDATEVAGSGGGFWTGYKFHVQEGVDIDMLMGGATSSDDSSLEIAIFRLGGEDNFIIQEVMVAVSAPTSRGEEVFFDPITLVANESYYLAQGGNQTSESFLVDNIDVEGLVRSGIPFVCEWEPSDGENSYSIQSYTPSYTLVGSNISTLHHFKPDIGFGGVATHCKCDIDPCGQVEFYDNDACEDKCSKDPDSGSVWMLSPA